MWRWELRWSLAHVFASNMLHCAGAVPCSLCEVRQADYFGWRRLSHPAQFRSRLCRAGLWMARRCWLHY